MILQHHRRAIAVFSNLDTAGQAVDQLVIAGFPLYKIFLLGQDTRLTTGVVDVPPTRELLRWESAQIAPNRARNLASGLVIGNVVGGSMGLLFSAGLLMVPGFSSIVLGSELLLLAASAVLGAVTGGAIGAWVGHEISAQQTKAHTNQLAQGNYLLLINGTESEVFRAEHILYVQGITPRCWL
jgi:uncharacterized membrane protein YsdA (DUF1294 family)